MQLYSKVTVELSGKTKLPCFSTSVEKLNFFFKYLRNFFVKFKMNNVVYSQVTSKPQDFALVPNDPQVFIPVAPITGLGNDQIVLPTPQNLPYSVVTSGPQKLEKKSNRDQGLIPGKHMIIQTHLPQVLLQSVNY